MLTTTDVERSIFKVLYDNFEVPEQVKIFDNIFYVDFAAFDRWIVIDSLSHSSGALPKANFTLHVSTKKGLRNEKYALTRLVDHVCELFYECARFDAYGDDTGQLKGEFEITKVSLLPIMQHAGGGSFRSLHFSVVYSGPVLSS